MGNVLANRGSPFTAKSNIIPVTLLTANAIHISTPPSNRRIYAHAVNATNVDFEASNVCTRFDKRFSGGRVLDDISNFVINLDKKFCAVAYVSKRNKTTHSSEEQCDAQFNINELGRNILVADHHFMRKLHSGRFSVGPRQCSIGSASTCHLKIAPTLDKNNEGHANEVDVTFYRRSNDSLTNGEDMVIVPSKLQDLHPDLILMQHHLKVTLAPTCIVIVIIYNRLHKD